jgi:hypothetical protein
MRVLDDRFGFCMIFPHPGRSMNKILLDHHSLPSVIPDIFESVRWAATVQNDNI